MPALQDRRVFEWRAPVRGLVLAASPRDLPPDALAECVNFDLDVEAGRLIRRDAWLSTDFAPDTGLIPTAVFELPATEPAGAPSTPRVVVALAPIASPTAALRWIWRLYMRPWWGGSSWINTSWGLVGSPGESFDTTLTPAGVSASVVGQDGAYRVYLSYGEATTDPPNNVVSFPAWLGFIPTSRVRFRAGNLPADFDPGPNKFVAEDARLLPPPTSLLSIELLSTGRSGATIPAGGRYYRLAYKYDGYQFGALSDAVAVDVPEEDGTFVQGVVHVLGVDIIGQRPTAILVFVQVAKKIQDGPGAYALLETVDLEKGPTSKSDATVIESNVTNTEPVLSRNLGGDQQPALVSWNATPVVNLRAGEDDADDPWRANQLYMFDTGLDSNYATVVRRHFHVEVSPGHDWLQKTDKFALDGASTFRMAFGSPSLFANRDGSTLLVPGTAAADRRSVTFENSIDHPTLADFVRSIVHAGDYLLNWDYPFSVQAPPSNAPFRAKPFGIVTTLTTGTGFVIVNFRNAMPFEPGVQVGYEWMVCHPGPLSEYSTSPLGMSFAEVSAPIFGADTDGTPSSDLVVTIGTQDFTEPAANLKATDGTTVIFTSTATYPSGTTHLNGALVSYGSTGWQRDVSYGNVTYHALARFMDTASDLSGLLTYEELAQDVSLTPWVRASSIARVGRQHFAGDLAIPDPTDRLNEAKDTLQRYRIVGGNVTGEGQVAPDFFPPTSVSSAGEGTSPIQWMGEWFGRLVVLTDESLYLAVPTSGGFLQPERRLRGYGCIGPRTAVLTPEGPVWLGRQGVVRFSGGSIDLLSAPLGSRLFLDAINQNGRQALGAWDARRARYLLYLVTDGLRYLYTVGRSGAWSRYQFQFDLVALCQDSSSSGIPSALAQLADDSYGLVEPDPNAIQDLGTTDVLATALYPEVEPAGGDHFAHVLEAALDFHGTVLLSVATEGGVKVTGTFTTVGQAHARLPVAARGRVASALVQTSSRGAFVDRVAFWAVPKGRVRS